MTDSRATRTGPAACAGVFAIAVAGAACAAVSPPSTDLSGTWDFSYSTRSTRPCPSWAPPDLRASCAGGGRLTLTQDGNRIAGTIPLRGGCTDCGMAIDFSGQAQSVNGQLDGARLALTVVRCHLSGTVRGDAVEQVTGDIGCTLEDAQTEGTWRMSRVE